MAVRDFAHKLWVMGKGCRLQWLSMGEKVKFNAKKQQNGQLKRKAEGLVWGVVEPIKQMSLGTPYIAPVSDLLDGYTKAKSG